MVWRGPIPRASSASSCGVADGSSHSYTASGFSLSRTVFPFQVAPGSGYSAYAGDCAAHEMIASTALGTPASGSSASLGLPVISRVITITRSGSTQGSVTVKASDSPDGCTDTYTLSGTTVMLRSRARPGGRDDVESVTTATR